MLKDKSAVSLWLGVEFQFSRTNQTLLIKSNAVILGFREVVNAKCFADEQKNHYPLADNGTLLVSDVLFSIL